MAGDKQRKEGAVLANGCVWRDPHVAPIYEPFKQVRIMKKFFITSAVFFDLVVVIIFVFSISVSAYDYFVGSAFDEEYPLFCDILYGNVLKYDLLFFLVCVACAFVMQVIEDRKDAKHEH